MINGPNMYAYCKNNPTKWVDPYGLFVFGKRPLERKFKIFKKEITLRTPRVRNFSGNSKLNRENLNVSHEHGFFGDGTGDNIGFGDKGRFSEDPAGKGYEYDTTHYDDDLMREAVENVRDGDYHGKIRDTSHLIGSLKNSVNTMDIR